MSVFRKQDTTDFF